MSDNLDAQPSGRLLALPKELRLLIYEQLFPPCKVDIHTPRRNSWVDVDDVCAKSPDLAILTTCHTIYAEAKPVLFNNTEFHIRFACSGPDLYMMQVGKHMIYPRLLQDLQGRVRSLFGQARKVSLSILFTDSDLWEDSEEEWFYQLTCELARLGEARQLKHLHITFEADENSGPARQEYVSIRKDFEHVLGKLRKIDCPAAVTTTVHPSLSQTDFRLEKYLGTIVELRWADTTHEVHSKKLARMFCRRSQLHQEIQDKVRWIASRCPVYGLLIDDIEKIYLGSLRLVKSGDREIDATFQEITELQVELKFLRLEITSIEEHLEWYTHKSWAHNRAY